MINETTPSPSTATAPSTSTMTTATATAPATTTSTATQYDRTLDFKDLLMSGLSTTVGVGIFVILSNVIANARGFSWISMLITGIMVLFTTFSYAELSSIYNKNSTEFEYIRDITNEPIALIVTTFIILLDILVLSTVTIGFGNHLSFLTNLDPMKISVASILIFNYINFLGIRKTVNFSHIALLIKLFAMGILIVIGLYNIDTSKLFEKNIGVQNIMNGSMYALFAYLGFSHIINLTEESVQPEKDIPKALIYTVSIVTILYTLITVVSIMTPNLDNLAKSQVPLADVSKYLLGNKYGQLFFVVLAIIALADSLLMNSVSSSRYVHGMLERFIPNFSQIDLHPTNKTPFLSILIVVGIVLTFIFTLKDTKYTSLYGDVIALISLILVNSAAIILRYKEPIKKRNYRMPLNIGEFPILSFLGLTTSSYILYKYMYMNVI